MRKWLIVVLVIVALGILIPFGFGVQINHQLKKLNDLQIPIKGGELGTLEFAVTDQKQGWRHSKAVITVSFRHPHTDIGESTTKTVPIITAHTKISHGPLLHQVSADGNEWMIGQALLQANMNYVAENLPARFLEITGIETGMASAFVALLGEQTIFVSTREISFQDVTGQLNFSGIDLEIERSRDGKKIVADMLIPHFNFLLYPPEDQAGGVRWLMDGVSLQFIGTVDHPAALWYGTWFGEVEALINNMQIDMDGNHYSINQFGFANIQKPDTDNSLLQGESEIQFERLLYNQKGYGPFEAILSYEHIDRAAVENIRTLYDDWLYADTQVDFMTYLNAQQRELFNNSLLALVNRLPDYKINNFFLVTDQGNLSGKFAMNVTGKANSAQELEGLSFWQQNLKMNLNIQASQALTQDFSTWMVQQFYNLIKLPLPLMPTPSGQPGVAPVVDYQGEAKNLLNQAQIFGIIKSANDEYAMDAQFQQGRLLFNGKPFIDFNQPATQPTEAKPNESTAN